MITWNSLTLTNVEDPAPVMTETSLSPLYELPGYSSSLCNDSDSVLYLCTGVQVCLRDFLPLSFLMIRLMYQSNTSASVDPPSVGH